MQVNIVEYLIVLLVNSILSIHCILIPNYTVNVTWKPNKQLSKDRCERICSSELKFFGMGLIEKAFILLTEFDPYDYYHDNYIYTVPLSSIIYSSTNHSMKQIMEIYLHDEKPLEMNYDLVRQAYPYYHDPQQNAFFMIQDSSVYQMCLQVPLTGTFCYKFLENRDPMTLYFFVPGYSETYDSLSYNLSKSVTPFSSIDPYIYYGVSYDNETIMIGQYNYVPTDVTLNGSEHLNILFDKRLVCVTENVSDDQLISLHDTSCPSGLVPQRWKVLNAFSDQRMMYLLNDHDNIFYIFDINVITSLKSFKLFKRPLKQFFRCDPLPNDTQTNKSTVKSKKSSTGKIMVIACYCCEKVNEKKSDKSPSGSSVRNSVHSINDIRSVSNNNDNKRMDSRESNEKRAYSCESNDKNGNPYESIVPSKTCHTNTSENYKVLGKRRQNTINSVNTQQSKNTVNTVNTQNSKNTINTVNTQNTRNTVNSVNTQHSKNTVNTKKRNNI
ncbi:hypothetical protein RDWZM_005614 [Blomia tropicalis]|uniref:Uncharacterized protein n=1 Tax=Blomia tropicalis TaxID=40697 RepID=A0A9Q0M6F6_BLOTA|nr:hypothetical protein RDWZM_005614 [Blomia tropicalis]